MTTYTDIPTTDTDVDSPVTQSLLERLANNPLAIAEGDVTAPRIAHKALANVTAGTVINGSNLSTVYASNTTSGDLTLSVGELYGFTGFSFNSMQEVASWTAPYDGVYSVSFTVGRGNISGNTEAQVYKNGVAFGSIGVVAGSGGAYNRTTYTEDLAFAAGDRIQIFVNFNNTGVTAAGNRQASISDIKIMNTENWGSGR